MEYPLTSITSGMDFDVLIEQLNDRRAPLVNKKQNLEFKSTNLVDDAADYEDQVADLTSELSFLQARLDTLPAASTRREKVETELMAIQLKLRKMNAQKATYGAIGATLRQFELNCIDQEIAEIDSLISQSNAAKNAMAGGN